jgi:hypothetical protein
MRFVRDAITNHMTDAFDDNARDAKEKMKAQSGARTHRQC